MDDVPLQSMSLMNRLVRAEQLRVEANRGGDEDAHVEHRNTLCITHHGTLPGGGKPAGVQPYTVGTDGPTIIELSEWLDLVAVSDS